MGSEGWVTKTVGDVAEIAGGSAFPRAFQGHTNLPVPFAKVSDMNLPGNEWEIDTAANTVDDKILRKTKARVFPLGTIVFPKVGAALLTNKRRVLATGAAIDNNLMALVPRAIDPTFLYYWSLTLDLTAYAQPGALPSVNQETVGAIPILVPSRTEQQRIAEVLQSVDVAIEATRTVIEQTRKVKQSLIQTLLTRGMGHTRFKRTEIGEVPEAWDVLTVGDLFEVQLGKMLSPKARAGLNPKPYLGNANVQWERIDVSDVGTMDFTCNELVKFRLEPGDLLVCEGGQIGRAAIWSGEIDECYYQKALHRLRPINGKILPEYMLHYLILQFQIRKTFAGQLGETTIAHLPRERLIRIPVGVPPLLEQERIVERLHAVRDSCAAAEAQLKVFQEIKRGLLQVLLITRLRTSGTNK